MTLGMPTGTNTGYNPQPPTLLKIVAQGIGEVDFDVAQKENHGRFADISDYPLEKGADVSDSSRPKPIKFRFHGIVSQTPAIAALSNNTGSPATGAIPSPDPMRASSARNQMIAFWENATTVEVVSAKEHYINMVVESIVEDPDVSNYNNFEADITLKQISVANTKNIQAPVPKSPKDAPTQSLSTKTPSSDTNPAPSQDMLSYDVHGTPGQPQ